MLSNSSLDQPLFHLPKDRLASTFSVTKHVLMLWVVSALVFFVVTLTVRRLSCVRTGRCPRVS
jgi:beta-lactamase regulating signal transducer with metallopeptidase domain